VGRLSVPYCVGLVALGALAVGGCAGKGRSLSGNGSGSGATGADAGAGGSSAGARGGTAGAMEAGTGGTGEGGAGGSSASGGTAGSTACTDTPVTTRKRIVPLTDGQLAAGYAALFGDAAPAMFTGEDVLPATQRAFPPLSTVGTSIAEPAWRLRRRAAERAAAHVSAGLATLTPCGDPPEDPACGLGAVLAFAEKAYRRPLTPAERSSYETLWTEITSAPGVSLADAIGYGHSAVLVAPGFLFRTETGGDFTTEGPITQYELASELSHFLTDGPPDAELLAAAAANRLDADAVRAHTRRILEGQYARDNLEAAMVSYFRLSVVPGVIISADAVPGFDFTPGVRGSMYREAQEFLKHTLWQGAVQDLLTSRRTWINSALAPVYGVTVPSDDVNVFYEVNLPADRAGLLTLSPFLVSRSRPTGASSTARGGAVSTGFACAELPLFPEGVSTDPELPDMSGWTERRKADYRLQSEDCADCHRLFDPMGLALENYDAIGRYRTEDPDGRAIDLSWTTSELPDLFDEDQDGDGTPEPTVVNSAVTLAEALVRERTEWGGTSAFTRCLALNLINYALAEESSGSARASRGQPPDSCAVRAVTDQLAAAPDQSFTSLLVEIAASDTLRVRKPGM
jgi:hypothetical protein